MVGIMFTGCAHSGTSIETVLGIGCSDLKTAEKVYNSSSVDLYNGVTSPVYHCNMKWTNNPVETKIFLRYFKGSPTYQVHMIYNAPKWLLFNSVVDNNGIQLPFVEIGKNAIRRHQETILIEHFLVTVSRSYLETARNDGLNFKAIGKKGSIVFKLPAYYVDGFLIKCDIVQ